MSRLSNNSDDFNNNLDKLKLDLENENDFITRLIDTIPAKMYFGNEIKEKILSAKHTIMDEKAEVLNKGRKRMKLSEKGKHKRARLDPLCQKNVTEIHGEIDEKKKRKPKKKKLDQLSTSLKRAANIEELQKRLEERIKEFQAKRKSIGRSDTAESKKLLASIKKKKQKANKIEKEKQVLNPYKTPKTEKTGESNSKPIYNKEGKILYSKFEFTENGEGETRKGEFTGKNYKKLLKKAEKKKEKIENLKTSNPTLAQNLEEKEKWKKAILKAENVKVKDDPTLLKKSIKKQEKIKKKKSKEWKERTEQVESRKEARQEKRTKNIQKRKNDKLEKKIKRAKKKGRVIPGF